MARGYFVHLIDLYVCQLQYQLRRFTESIERIERECIPGNEMNIAQRPRVRSFGHGLRICEICANYIFYSSKRTYSFGKALLFLARNSDTNKA